MMKKLLIISLSVLTILLCYAVALHNKEVGSDSNKDSYVSSESRIKSDKEHEKHDIDTMPDEGKKGIEVVNQVASDKSITGEILTFVDVYGEEYETEVLQNVPKTDIAKEKYSHDGNKLTYEDDIYYSRIGVDVSHHQGSINWKKVKADGYDFAFIRMGYRGYGQEGSVNLDRRFEENVKKAQEAGIDVGVYFFAQAINEDEAREEAEFVIDHLVGYDIELPVVYDPESVLDKKARTDDVSGEQFTKNTLLFCSLIKDAGYEPMIYSNMLWEAFQFDMVKVSKYPFWYADYESEPQTPYKYEYWQYTNKGNVDGISGSVDLDIELIRK